MNEGHSFFSAMTGGTVLLLLAVAAARTPPLLRHGPASIYPLPLVSKSIDESCEPDWSVRAPVLPDALPLDICLTAGSKPEG
jgi:hypothetical protein